MFEIIKYRYLLAFLVRKELRVKYRNTLLGYFWSLLEPIGLMIIYSIVFSFIAKFDMDNYPLFLISGLIPWMFVNHSVVRGTKILALNATLIKKVYFPRQLFPLTVVSTNLVNLLISLALITVFSLFVGAFHFTSVLILPLAIVLQFFLVLGVVLLLSAISVYYRDVEFVSSLGIRGWMYLSPIIYPLHIIPGQYHNLYMLNPMATIITIYHNVFYGGEGIEMVSIQWIGYTIIFIVVLLLISWKLFDRMSKRMGEVI
ncbi:ABC transporter permease [Alkalihalobacillus sp. 1P02AB]|uniref:ABC transporter permease n=1 Tax=Alkalihalobacillus sp. 1P02AB TaxID=3132260 RepID=UPI0039A572F3